GGGGYKRSVAVEELYYNEDGTIETIPMTGDGPEACDTLNPYQRVEAETMAEGKGIEKQCFYPDEPENKDVYVTDIENGDCIVIKDVDFTQYGAVEFIAQTSSEVAKGETAGHIEVRLDSEKGELLCDYEVLGTGSYDLWSSTTVDIDKTKATGTHDLYLCFTGDEEKTKLFKFDYWQFTQDEIPATPVPVVTAAPVISPAPVNTATPAPKETTAPEIKAPAKAKINSVKSTGKGKVKVNIKRVKDAKGYRIKYSVNKSFKKAVKSIVIKKNTVTIKKLKSRKKYYFKAQAFVNDATGKKLYGKFSNTVKVKVR
ncbi:MAG: carbohydrate-binding protein, partial [Lachnospiraceae bacterium]|nr:carbohydrate-binding protein [Lachnospiraceae bacterium]